MTRSMQAAAVRALGGPVELIDLPVPEPGEGEVRVHLSAAGVNPFDWKILDGVLSPRRPHRFPLILGVDGAGTVDRLGPGCGEFRIGDRVFGNFLHDPVGTGTYAEWTAGPERLPIVKVPESVSFEVAAALPMAGMTGIQSIRSLDLPSGGSVGIVGATGGVGSFATQYAATTGLRVVAFVRPGGEQRARELGASEVVAITDDLPPERPGGDGTAGLDGLLDLVHAREDLARFSEIVREGGAVASTVGAVDPEALARRRIRGTNIDLKPRRDLLEELGRLVAEGRLRVALEERLPLSRAPEAIARSRTGRSRGKTVLITGPGTSP